MACLAATRTAQQPTGAALHVHGGYGFMDEYPISQDYADSRIQTIYGGTTEIQKEIIGRMLGL